MYTYKYIHVCIHTHLSIYLSIYLFISLFLSKKKEKGKKKNIYMMHKFSVETIAFERGQHVQGKKNIIILI